MILRVGPFLYRVRKVASPLLYEGQPCLGLCDFQQQEILIADQGSELQQIQVIGHEYMEAWLHHMGPQLDDHEQKEAACDTFGMALTQFMMDYTRAIRQHLGDPPPPTGTASAAASPSTTPWPVDDQPIQPFHGRMSDRSQRPAQSDPPGPATKRWSPSSPAVCRAGRSCLVRSEYHPFSRQGGWMVRVMEPA